MNVKVLAERVLQGNRQGNRKETKSFLIPKNRKPETTPRETLPFGLTLTDLQAEYGHDPVWPKVKDDPRWLHHLAGTRPEPPEDSRTAHRLSPAERAQWCLDHELTFPDHRCPNKGTLKKCTLWRAVCARTPVSEILR